MISFDAGIDNQFAKGNGTFTGGLALFGPHFLDPSVEQAVLFTENVAWSFNVLPADANLNRLRYIINKT